MSGEKKTELGMRVWGSSRGWGNPLGGREGRLEQQPWILGGIGGRDWGSSKVGGQWGEEGGDSFPCKPSLERGAAIASLKHTTFPYKRVR